MEVLLSTTIWLVFAIVLPFIPQSVSIFQSLSIASASNSLGSKSIYSKICNNSTKCDAATCYSHQNACICKVDKQGLCIPKVKPLGNCTADIECEQKVGQKLICLNGLCDCDPSESMYSTALASIKWSDVSSYPDRWQYNARFHGFTGASLTQCVGRIGSPCIDRRCVLNSFCSFPTNQHAIDQRGTCKCNSEYNVSKTGTCGTGYNSSCSSSSSCLDGLNCINFKCLCPFDTQTYDSSSKLCLSQVGGPCHDDLSCQSNAECKNSNQESGSESEAGHCTCKSGFVENLKGKCESAFGTQCSSASDCDSIAGLQCIDKKCKCGKFAGFNSIMRKCVGLVGAKCNLRLEDECTANAYCRRVNPRQLPGSCTCQQGFKETANYECKSEQIH